ncbi:MAG: hypothetical protein HOG89_01755 [Candidatus Peribacter sp.]|jgi:hypothetical protein|nr:hypothetical protein [Candidatus Peribacter sp.]MBT4392834.1 hypothetical protein [Candidatus Peribacter sp.]MBT4601465.1 hypothetical protein [Candidatus Peribacter sp.]MBT5148782.1 hypothetical protein [Candidatus Peribacter sp.]MBT5637622.1 hypothetical protein [Candidatus Peribacter sp.]
MSEEFPVHVYFPAIPGQTAEEVAREQVEYAALLSEIFASEGFDVTITPDDVTIGTNDDPDAEPWILE